MVDPPEGDRFPEAKRDGDAGAVFVLESKGDRASSIRSSTDYGAMMNHRRPTTYADSMPRRRESDPFPRPANLSQAMSSSSIFFFPWCMQGSGGTRGTT